MPTLSILWKVRKETFSYRDEILPAFLAFVVLSFLSLSVSAVLFLILFNQLGIPPYFWYDMKEATSVDTTFIHAFLVVGSSIGVMSTYGAYLIKSIVSSEDEYRFGIPIKSQLERIRTPLKILGLESNYISYDALTKIIDNTTQEESKDVRLYFYDNKFFLELYNLNKPDQDKFGFAGEDNCKEIKSFEINPLSQIRFYLMWKALMFSGFKLFNRQLDLNSYGSLFLRGASFRKLKQGSKFGLSSEKINFLIKNKVPLQQYEVAKDIPLIWLNKAYGEAKLIVDNQFVVC